MTTFLFKYLKIIIIMIISYWFILSDTITKKTVISFEHLNK